MDGASRMQTIWHIYLPHMKPTIIVQLILQVGSMLSIGFEKVYLMQNNLNLSASEMLPTFTYKTGMESHNYGYATAAGLFNSVVSVALVYIANAISRKVGETSLF